MNETTRAERAASSGDERTQRLLGGAAALLFALSLLSGLYAGAAMSGKLAVNPGAALASHLNGMMGAFLLVSFGWTLPMLRYGAAGRRRIALAFVLTSYANWSV